MSESLEYYSKKFGYCQSLLMASETLMETILCFMLASIGRAVFLHRNCRLVVC